MHQGARHRHPLQLPATELLRQAVAQPAQAHGVQHGLHAGVVVLVQQHQRQRHVLRHAQMCQHMKSLKNKADFLAAQAGQSFLTHAAQATQVYAVQHHRATLPGVQSGHAIQQGGLAHSGLAHNGHEFSWRHGQRHIAEDRHLAVMFTQAGDHQAHDFAPGWVRQKSRATART